MLLVQFNFGKADRFQYNTGAFAYAQGAGKLAYVGVDEEWDEYIRRLESMSLNVYKLSTKAPTPHYTASERFPSILVTVD